MSSPLPQARYKCSPCEKTYLTRPAYEGHLRNTHGGVEPSGNRPAVAPAVAPTVPARGLTELRPLPAPLAALLQRLIDEKMRAAARVGRLQDQIRELDAAIKALGERKDGDRG